MTNDAIRPDNDATPSPSLDERIEADTDRLRGDMRVALTAAARLRKDLEKAQPMPDGTVVRFESISGTNGHRYAYAAIFTNGSWWFTGRDTNTFFPRSCTHQEFTAQLVSQGRTIVGLAVATGWEGIEL